VSTDVTAPFVALRGVAGVDADKLLAEFDSIAEQINELLAKAGSGDAAVLVDDLFALVQRAVAVLDHVVALKACRALPPGFEPGLADGYFANAFRQLALALLARADDLTVDQLLTVLWVAYQTGAVGASSRRRARRCSPSSATR